MYGGALAREARGHVDSGLGKSRPVGTLSIAAPTDAIDHTPQAMESTACAFVFQ